MCWEQGEIFACGYNIQGQCGLGHFDIQITPNLIPNLPSNIVQFVCGGSQSLFLSEGNVFSVGDNGWSTWSWSQYRPECVEQDTQFTTH